MSGSGAGRNANPMVGDGVEMTQKRKRGRPRKVGPVEPEPAPAPVPVPVMVPVTAPTASSILPVLVLTGTGFAPHIITVGIGEDVASKLMSSYPTDCPTHIWIMSAYGALSDVTLNRASDPSSKMTYSGRFDILSLSGAIMKSFSHGHRATTVDLYVSFAVPDGQVMGGAVKGVLRAESPVQVMVASFYPNNEIESLSSPPSHTTRSESSRMPT